MWLRLRNVWTICCPKRTLRRFSMKSRLLVRSCSRTSSHNFLITMRTEKPPPTHWSNITKSSKIRTKQFRSSTKNLLSQISLFSSSCLQNHAVATKLGTRSQLRSQRAAARISTRIPMFKIEESCWMKCRLWWSS